MHTPIKVQETKLPNASIKNKEASSAMYVNATLNPCVLEEKVRSIEKKSVNRFRKPAQFTASAFLAAQLLSLLRHRLQPTICWL